MKLYIDPGTGSMLFSLAIGLVSVFWFGTRKLHMKLKYLIPGKARIDTKKIPLVIYSDDKRYWQIFEPVCRELDRRAFDVTYLTASPDDPALDSDLCHLHAEFIGEGNRQFLRLNFLNAWMVLSTTPGLDVYQWKRSKTANYYIHMLHGMEVIGYAYFGVDFYDSLLLSSAHHEEEIRELESMREEPAKEIALVGIPYWDEMARRLAESEAPPAQETTVLLATSWREMALLSRFGSRIIDALIETGYHIIIRPHPQSFTSEKEMLDRLMKKYPESDQLEWNRDADNFEVLRRSDIMVSDYSGVVFDFALVHDKPVICAPVEWDDSGYDLEWLDKTSWTQSSLPRIGALLNEDNINNIKEMIDACLADDSYRKERHRVRDEAWLYQGEGSARIADYLMEKYHQISKEA